MMYIISYLYIVYDISPSDKCEHEHVISSIAKELEILNLQAEQLSKKTTLKEKQLDDSKKQNAQEEQGKVSSDLDTSIIL